MTVVYQSRIMHDLLDQARRFARTSAPVLLTGESGTGKELLARRIHEHSSRCERPYLQVNCAALSGQLIESELFGHEAGAFTGATQSRIGRLEGAGDGTLLLDEIGELPLDTQAKLLRALEERELQRVGSNRTLPVNCRFVSATNRCLETAVAAGRLREDLLHRINVLTLEIPPLRARREDIPALVQHFLRRYQTEGEHRVERVSSRAMRQLCDFDWPGNVRQLRNFILRSCVLCLSNELDHVELPKAQEPEIKDTELPDDFLELPLEEIERRVIIARIRQANGNKAAAAETLGVSSRTLRNKIDRYRRLGVMS